MASGASRCILTNGVAALTLALSTSTLTNNMFGYCRGSFGCKTAGFAVCAGPDSHSRPCEQRSMTQHAALSKAAGHPHAEQYAIQQGACLTCSLICSMIGAICSIDGKMLQGTERETAKSTASPYHFARPAPCGVCINYHLHPHTGQVSAFKKLRQRALFPSVCTLLVVLCIM